jgi:hypothetical protein
MKRKKYGHVLQRDRNQEWMCRRSPEANYSCAVEGGEYLKVLTSLHTEYEVLPDDGLVRSKRAATNDVWNDILNYIL